MNFQIDVKPHDEKTMVHKVNLYIGGCCYTVYGTVGQIELMKDNGLIAQTFGQRHDENNNLVNFEYPEGVDGAGVKYTSRVFKMEELKHG